MVVIKPVTMAEMRKSRAIPKSPTQTHQERIGKGNYNRFKHLQNPRDRSKLKVSAREVIVTTCLRTPATRRPGWTRSCW